MSSHWQAGSSAREAYDAFASSYDDFNRDYQFERWTGRLLEKAEAAGLEGDRLLDVACGTGLSFLPMLDRGWRVTGCDISPAMVEVARAKVPDRSMLLVADMRELPDLGEFDLIWALNDALNYLHSVEELQATLRGMRKNLADEGVMLFDVSTLTTYRNFFGQSFMVEEKGRRFQWEGQAEPGEVAPGALVEARFEAEGEDGSIHVHRQRHFPEQTILGSLAAAGLTSVQRYGELGGDLYSDLDEEEHTKAVYVCRK
jgi:predicted TPR repeat methyltransferase